MAQFALAAFYAPLFFAGFVGTALWLVASGANELWLIPLLIGAIAASTLAERVLPYEPKWNRDRGDGWRDLVHAMVNEGTTVLSVASIPTLLSLVSVAEVWPTHWPLWVQLAVAILVADLGITLAHYASHRVEWLWRLHAVHHSVERLYGFNGLMKHPLHQVVETVAGTTPLVLVGLPVEVGALLGFAVGIQLLLQHSNVDMRVGPLAYVWAVAPGHRHHHLASHGDGDVNFGLFTLLWDHLLGTFIIRRRSPRDGEVGIAGRNDFPVDYWDQLLEPFRRWPVRESKQRVPMAE